MSVYSPVNPNITSFVPAGGRYVVNVSDPVTFECVATGVPAPTIQWFRGEDILDSSDSRISLGEPALMEPSRDLATVRRTLTISSTLKNDTDMAYSCRANNTASGGVDSEMFQLFIQGMWRVANFSRTNCIFMILLSISVPPVVVSLVPNQRVVANVTDTAILTFRIDCDIPRVLPFDLRWYYTANTMSGDPDFTSNDFLEITNLTNRTSSSMLTYSEDLLTLTVSDIVQALVGGAETDAGRYFFRATNPAGEGNGYIDLVVRGPPQIVGGPHDQFAINNGSSAVFGCNAIAEPQHEVVWTFIDFNGVEFKSIAATTAAETALGKYAINGNSSTPTFGELTVNNVTFGDRGTYICAAENSIGEENAQANLTVHGESVNAVLLVASSISPLQLFPSFTTSRCPARPC